MFLHEKQQKAARCKKTMAVNRLKHKDDLLADLEASIEKALEARMVDLAGALYRLQGSARGWCDHSDCSDCPLAPMMCVTALDDRVHELIKVHHQKHEALQTSTELPCPAEDPTDTPVSTEPLPENSATPMADATIKLYASRLHHQLGSNAPAYVSKKIRSIDPRLDPERAKGWKRIRAALTSVALDQKFGDDDRY
jgi:hypothetical protein